MSYYRTCPHCGAHLDPGEVCDCINSLYASLSAENKQLVEAKIAELLSEQNTALDAENIQGGKAEQNLPGTVSAFSITDEGGLVK